MAKKRTKRAGNQIDAGKATSEPSRGAKRRADQRADQRQADDAGTPRPIGSPRFWFGFEISWSKLVLARVVIFGLLAVDALFSIRHAPRYGAGGFNVGHLPLLDGLGAGRVGYEIGQLVAAYLFVLAALGVATRAVVPIATAIFAWLYFGSQLDSYQHHYLVVLLLLVACFVPWQRPPDCEPATKIRSWAIRLMLVQLAIMYLWAAISKLDPAWLDGRTLDGQITGAMRSLVDKTVGIKTAARLVVGVELALAATVWLRPAWIVAAPLGLAFHFGITRTELEIGLFGYLMVGVYVLVVPEVVWVWLAETAPVRIVRAILRAFRSEAALAWGAGALGLAIGTAGAILCRFEHALVVGIVLALVPIAISVVARLRTHPVRPMALGAAQLLALGLWILVDRSTWIAFDYYRFWGDSQRRLGNLETAAQAFRKVTVIAPDAERGHFQLGRVLLDLDRTQEGIDQLHEAQRLDPAMGRALIEEASWLAKQGRKPEAIEKAREATYAEPNSSIARTLLDKLSGTKKDSKPDAANPDHKDKDKDNDKDSDNDAKQQ